MSARIPFTILLLTSLVEKLSQSDHALFFSSSHLRKTKSLETYLLFSIFANTAVSLVELLLVLLVVPLDDSDFLVSEARNPANDLLMGTTLLNVSAEILHGDRRRR